MPDSISPHAALDASSVAASSKHAACGVEPLNFKVRLPTVYNDMLSSLAEQSETVVKRMLADTKTTGTRMLRSTLDVEVWSASVD